MDALNDVPPSLKGLKPYLTHAKQTERFDKLIAYYCRCYAVQLGIELNKQTPHPDNKTTLLALLDRLEADKKELGNIIEQEESKAPYVKGFANKIFDKADSDDRAGRATRETARAFYAASIYYTTMKQFNPDGFLDDDVSERLKYAKWKAADINLAIKEGRKPTPGPALSSEEEEFRITEEEPTGESNLQNGDITMKEDSTPLPPPSIDVSSLQSISVESSSSSLSFSLSVDPSPQPQNHFPSQSPSPPIPSLPSIPSHSSSPPIQTPTTPPIQIYPPSPSQPQPQPQSYSNQPSNQFPPQQFNQMNNQYAMQPSQVAPQIKNGFITYMPTIYDNLGRSDEAIEKAMRHAKYAVSSLQFDDIPSAIENLKLSLRDLGINV